MNAHSIIHGRAEQITALFEQMPDTDGLRVISDMLNRWSGTYAYDRAINALAEIADEMEIEDPFELRPLTTYARGFSPEVEAELREVAARVGETWCDVPSDPLQLVTRDNNDGQQGGV